MYNTVHKLHNFFRFCKSKQQFDGINFQIGAGMGGVAGMYNGIIATNLAKQTGKLRRTQ